MKWTSSFIWFLFGAIILTTLPAGVNLQNQDYISEIRGKMMWMENEIRNTLASRCSIQVQSLSTYIQTVWWPHIQYLASRIPLDEQQQVLKDYTRLQYLLGIRKCQSPYETFYEGKCYRTGIPGNPCPRYQQLYNGPDNNGYCYCQRNGGKLNGLVYMDGQCYMQNEQGPCDDGEWLTVQGQTPVCEQVPQGCPADGQHVYWSCNDGKTQCQRRRKQSNNTPRCSRLGSQQPSCGAGAKLIRNGMKSYCGAPRMVDVKEPPVAMVFPSAKKSCQAEPVLPVMEENILEPFEQEPVAEESEGELIIDFNVDPPNRNRNNLVSINNRLVKSRPCPRNFYRDIIDGRCKRMY